MVEHSPKILTSEEKQTNKQKNTTTTTFGSLFPLEVQKAYSLYPFPVVPLDCGFDVVGDRKRIQLLPNLVFQ